VTAVKAGDQRGEFRFPVRNRENKEHVNQVPNVSKTQCEEPLEDKKTQKGEKREIM